jgi:predicted helicase
VFQTHFDQPATNMIQLRKKTTKSKGTLFEVFCVMYLKAKGYDQVWMLSEVPEEELKNLGLTRYDCGIDLIAKIPKTQSSEGEARPGFLYFPIQCKYRKPTPLKHKVGWKDVSTFLSLCSRTGGQQGWAKHIIMTNADNVTWRGRKTKKDYTIAKGTFQKCANIFWLKFISKEAFQPENPLSESVPPSLESLRAKRQIWLDRLLTEKN